MKSLTGIDKVLTGIDQSIDQYHSIYWNNHLFFKEYYNKY